MLHGRGGHYTCTRWCCLSKDIFSYDLRTLLCPPLVGALLCLLELGASADSGTAAPDRVGKASPSVSVFARTPLCLTHVSIVDVSPVMF